MDLLNGSKYVPTYEDKDDDWMLVRNVPWGQAVRVPSLLLPLLASAPAPSSLAYRCSRDRSPPPSPSSIQTDFAYYLKASLIPYPLIGCHE